MPNSLRPFSNAHVSPALSLPPELLSYIFCLASDRDPSDIQLGHVCQLWRHVLFNTSEFWQAILNGNDIQSLDPAFLKFSLERSSHRSIEIFHIVHPSSVSEVLSGHWNRFTLLSIEVQGSDAFSEFHHLLATTTMHHLKDLSIAFWSD